MPEIIALILWAVLPSVQLSTGAFNGLNFTLNWVSNTITGLTAVHNAQVSFPGVHKIQS